MDGGENWITLSKTICSENLHDVRFINQVKGWAVGYNGTILTTNNGGLTWEDNSISTNYSLSSVFFNDSLIGHAAGDDSQGGVILSTSDGGINWSEKYSNSSIYSINSVFL